MNVTEEKTIQLSKKKLLLLTGGSIIFALIGMWMFLLDAETIESHRRFNNPIFVHSLGFVSAVLCSLITFLSIKKLTDYHPGLVFNSHGIVHNSSIFSMMFISWSDITGSKIKEINRQKSLVITLTNPEKYIAHSNVFIKILNKMNHKFYGSPVTISVNALQMEFSELTNTFDDYFNLYAKSEV